ncbi:MAG: tetratricopeptide repeat protein [Nanoarchaeota archaeon]|nr:tetratricopeptide repeat protein [Nanoarchaeota archaeon]
MTQRPLETDLEEKLRQLLASDPDTEEVRSLIEEIHRQPLDMSLYLKLGDVLRDNLRIEEALTEYRAAERLEPGDESPKLRLAELYYDLDMMKESLGHYKEAWDIIGPNLNHSRLLAMAGILENDNPEEAMRGMFGRLLRNQDYDNNNLYHGLLRLDAEPGYAVHMLKRAARDTAYCDAVRQNACYWTGIARMRTNDAVSATKSFMEALELDGDDTDSLLGLASAVWISYSNEDGAEYYRQAVAKRPFALRVHMRLAEAEKALGNLEASLEGYKQALKLNPKSAAVHMALGLVYQGLCSTDMAVHHLNQAASLDKDDSTPHYHLARILQGKSKFDEAEKEYRLAIEKDPENPETFFQFGWLYNLRKDRQSAHDMFGKAAELCPTMSRYTLQFAKAQEGLGFKDGAKETYQKTVDANPLEPEVHFELGSFLERVSDFDGATKAYKEAVMLDEMVKLEKSNKQYAEALQKVLRR